MTRQMIRILMRNGQKTALLITQFVLAFVSVYLLIVEVTNLTISLTTDTGYTVDNYVVGSMSRMWAARELPVEDRRALLARLKQAKQEVEDLNYVESMGYMRMFPIANSSSNSNDFQVNSLTIDAMKTLRLDVTEGGMFTREMEFDDKKYIMVDQEAYDEFLRVTDEPVGHSFRWLSLKAFGDGERNADEIDEFGDDRLVGAVREFKTRGRYWFDRTYARIEFARFENSDYYLTEENKGKIYHLSSFVIRTDGSVSNAVAMQEIDKIYRRVLPERVTRVYSLPQLEVASGEAMKTRFIMLLIIALIVLYIVIIGVLAITKENILKRYREIGIRMALGSTEDQVRKQFWGELLITTGIGFVLSFIALLLLGFSGAMAVELGWEEALGTFVFFYGTIVLSTYYSITKASRLRPNIALHYE